MFDSSRIPGAVVPLERTPTKRRGHQNDELAVAIGYFAAERQPGPERKIVTQELRVVSESSEAIEGLS